MPLAKREPAVTDEQIKTAMEWLDINEGDEGEAEACKAVITFLQKELDRRQERRTAHALGRACAALRRINAEKAAKAQPELVKAFKDLGVKK